MSTRSKIARFVAVAALSATLGLHWAFLQTLAWTGMLIAYSQSDGFPTAITKTFDGKHPCPLCRLVAEGRQTGKTPGPYTPPPIQQLEFCLQDHPPLPLRLAPFPEPHPAEACAASRRDPPPVPPPRLHPA